MRLLPRPVYERGADSAAPFSRDTLGREVLARNLTRLLKKSSDGLVIALDGKWGEGKTSFIKFWNLLLEQDEEFIPIYYDAFRLDFTGDAFVSIAAAIHKSLGEHLKGQMTAKDAQAQLAHLKKASKDLAVGLAKMTAGLAVSSFTGGLISSEAVTEWAQKSVEKVTFDTLEVKADAQFEAYLRSQDMVQSYQQRLRELIDPAGGRGQRKIIMFVDELDRCRPIFAVEILEKIKHFFNIPGVFFVLSMNKEQLLRTIASVYGIGDESAVYLQKFVDLEARLPSVGEGALRSHQEVLRHFQAIAEELIIAAGPLSIMSEVDTITALVPAQIKLNARSIEKAVSLMALGLHSCEERDAVRLKPYIVTAALIRAGAPDYYSRLRQEGRFQEDYQNNQHRWIFEWAKKKFEKEREDKAANVFIVPQIGEACRVLELYEIPGPSLQSVDKADVPEGRPGSSASG